MGVLAAFTLAAGTARGPGVAGAPLAAAGLLARCGFCAATRAAVALQ